MISNDIFIEKKKEKNITGYVSFPCEPQKETRDPLNGFCFVQEQDADEETTRWLCAIVIVQGMWICTLFAEWYNENKHLDSKTRTRIEVPRTFN